MSEEKEPTQASHVILMRAAHTDPRSPAAEPDRPLSAQGKAAALAAARAMFGAGHHPGPLLASTARSARETAGIVAAEAHVPPSDVFFSDRVPGADTDILEVEIRPLAVPYTLVTLVAHEPGISELGRILSRNPRAPVFQPGEWRYLPWPPPY
jgi:phosphohistidine phosphatase